MPAKYFARWTPCAWWLHLCPIRPARPILATCILIKVSLLDTARVFIQPRMYPLSRLRIAPNTLLWQAKKIRSFGRASAKAMSADRFLATQTPLLWARTVVPCRHPRNRVPGRPPKIAVPLATLGMSNFLRALDGTDHSHFPEIC